MDREAERSAREILLRLEQPLFEEIKYFPASNPQDHRLLQEDIARCDNLARTSQEFAREYQELPDHLADKVKDQIQEHIKGLLQADCDRNGQQTTVINHILYSVKWSIDHLKRMDNPFADQKATNDLLTISAPERSREKKALVSKLAKIEGAINDSTNHIRGALTSLFADLMSFREMKVQLAAHDEAEKIARVIQQEHIRASREIEIEAQKKKKILLSSMTSRVQEQLEAKDNNWRRPNQHADQDKPLDVVSQLQQQIERLTQELAVQQMKSMQIGEPQKIGEMGDQDDDLIDPDEMTDVFAQQ